MKQFSMRTIVSFLSCLTLLSSAGCNSGGGSPTKPGSPRTLVDGRGCVVSDDAVLAYTNYERCLQGVAPLTANSQLDTAAQCHSDDMLTRQYVAHESPAPSPCGGTDAGQRISTAGYEWETFGENVISGFKSPKSIVSAWMKSPEHRLNLLNPRFKEMGIGRSGRIWTQLFGSR